MTAGSILHLPYIYAIDIRYIETITISRIDE